MRKYFFFAFLLYVISGCIEPVNIVPPKDKVVVVNCLITYQDFQTLKLNYAAARGSSNYEEVTNARASLYFNGEYIGDFQKKGFGEWKLKYRPTGKGEYKLVVNIPNHDEITATTYLGAGRKVWRCRQLDSKYKKHFKASSAGAFWAFAFRKDKDSTYASMNIKIDKEFRLIEEIGSNYPCIDSFNIIDEEVPMTYSQKHYFYLRMLDNLTAGEVDFFIDPLRSSIVVFRMSSNEYDQYLKSSLAKLNIYDAEGDPARWLNDSEIYSNVKNGTGIFAAYYDLIYNCNDNPAILEYDFGI